MAEINRVYADFKEYMSKPMRKDIPSVSYFSMEYAGLRLRKRVFASLFHTHQRFFASSSRGLSLAGNSDFTVMSRHTGALGWDGPTTTTTNASEP